MRQGGFSTLGVVTLCAALFVLAPATAAAEEAPPAEPAATVAPSPPAHPKAPAASSKSASAPRPDPAPVPETRPAASTPARPPAPAQEPQVAPPPPQPASPAAAAPPRSSAPAQPAGPARSVTPKRTQRPPRVATALARAPSASARLAAIEPEFRSVAFRQPTPTVTLEAPSVPRVFLFAGLGLLAGSLLLLLLASLPPQAVPWPAVYHALELRRHAIVVFAAAASLEVALIFVLFGWEGS